MTPSDHNRTLGVIHALLGALVLMGLVVAAISEVRRHPAEVSERLPWMLYVLPLPLLQLLTGFGLLKTRRWGRVLAFVLSAVYVWLFPLGTLLAVYTVWFLQGEGARQLYLSSPASESGKAHGV
jgi:glycerol uptake facilitator-like aquaporin